ncbi:hypothetical protein BKA70DRAFT_241544 [Coprinopsis sp. MPI-PUGE-AT-0042]|nr:hypothetical protein BKA70DRAFT_241544 [Coprinopsis sp. MPI-PUGE-AT-0042]
MCAHFGLTQDINPSLLRIVLLAVGHDLHWTIISLVPTIALSLADTILGHTKATIFGPTKDLGCPCLCSLAPSRRFPTASIVRRYRRHQYRLCLSGFLAVPLWFGGCRKKPSVGPPCKSYPYRFGSNAYRLLVMSPIRWSSSTLIQRPPEHSTAALRPRPGQFDRA